MNIRIYDRGQHQLDRYTVVLMDFPERYDPGIYAALSMGADMRGYSQHCSAMPGWHLGRRIGLAELPTQGHIDFVLNEFISDSGQCLDPMTAEYIDCALFFSALDDYHVCSDVPANQVRAALLDCYKFRVAAGDMLNAWSDEQAGHALWLTRNSLSAGFLNCKKGRKKTRDALTKLAQDMGGRDLYIGDDGKIYGFKD